MVVHELVVVPVERLADEGEAVWARTVGPVELARKVMQPVEEAVIQAIGHIEAKPVDAELAHPEAHGVEQVVGDGGVLEVEFHELEVPLPALVPKAVAVGGVPIEVGDEPLAIRALPTVLLQVAKRPETSPYMVEHGIEHHTDPVGVKLGNHPGKVPVATQAPIDCAQVTRIVAMRIGLEHRVQDDRADAQPLEIARPLGHLGQRGRRRRLRRRVHGSVLARPAAEAKRID